jgi:hypothetical protein
MDVMIDEALGSELGITVNSLHACSDFTKL